MSVIQISKIQERRGLELELPGAPVNLTPLAFGPGLDAGQIAFATDTGRLFVGHSPNVGQVNYRRTSFPYQNIEVLTEASTDTLRRIFGGLRRDVGSDGFYTALLAPGEDWQDVAVSQTNGQGLVYTVPGFDLIAAIEYFLVAEYIDAQGPHRDALRQGTLRILSHEALDEAEVIDEGVSARRLDLVRPFSVEGAAVSENVIFRMIRDFDATTPRFKLQYLSYLDHAARLYFSVQRPTASKSDLAFTSGAAVSPGGTGTGSGGGFTEQQIRDIVGGMVSGGVESGINVAYNTATSKLDFTATFADQHIRDVVGQMVTGDAQSGIQVTYNPYTSKIDFSVNTSLTPKNVQDIIGAMVANNAESGVNVVYDQAAAKLDFTVLGVPSPQDVRDLVGAMVTGDTQTGIAVVYNTATTKLDFVVSTTNIQQIVGGMVQNDVQNGIAVTYDPNAQKLNFNVLAKNIQDTVGGMVSGNTEDGIAVTYDSNASKLNFVVDRQTIRDTVGGMVSGNNEDGVSVTYNTGTSKIDFAVLPSKIQAVVGAMVSNNVENGVAVTYDPNAQVLNFNLLAKSVQDIVGGMVQGDNQANIAVTYNTATSKLDFNVPRYSQQDIQNIVGGMVQGDNQSGIQVVYNTSTSKLDFVVPPTYTQKQIQDIVGQMVVGDVQNGIQVTYDNNASKLNFNVTPSYSQQDIKNIVGSMVQGDNQAGVQVSYNTNSSKLDFNVLTNVALSGDVNGSGTINGGSGTISTALAANGVQPGFYTSPQLSVDATGRVTGISQGPTAIYNHTTGDGRIQTLGGNAAGQDTIWSTAFEEVIDCYPTHQRSIWLSGYIAGPGTNYNVQRYMRLLLDGVPLLQTAALYGWPCMGGNLSLSTIDTFAGRGNQIRLTVQTAWICTDSAYTTLNYNVSAINITYLSYRPIGGTQIFSSTGDH